MAKAAAMMTGTTVESRVLGSAWPQHGNRPIAEAMYDNIKPVGMPEWSEADQQFAKALSARDGRAGARAVDAGRGRCAAASSIPDEEQTGGASDDIGDVMWSVPTVTLRFPSNIPGAIGHHWTSAVAMATPVAHKGATQGAKVYGDDDHRSADAARCGHRRARLLRNVQQAPNKYKPLLRPEDKPAIWLNKDTMDRFKPELQKFYYDPTKYKSYLEQLGIAYPPPMPPKGRNTNNRQGALSGSPLARQSARSRRSAFAITMPTRRYPRRSPSIASPLRRHRRDDERRLQTRIEMARFALMLLIVVRLRRSA